MCGLCVCVSVVTELKLEDLSFSEWPETSAILDQKLLRIRLMAKGFKPRASQSQSNRANLKTTKPSSNEDLLKFCSMIR